MYCKAAKITSVSYFVYLKYNLYTLFKNNAKTIKNG